MIQILIPIYYIVQILMIFDLSEVTQKHIMVNENNVCQ